MIFHFKFGTYVENKKMQRNLGLKTIIFKHKWQYILNECPWQIIS